MRRWRHFGRTTLLRGKKIRRTSIRSLPWVSGCLLIAVGSGASAQQKYPGQTLPDVSAPRVVPYRPAAPAYRLPATRPPDPATGAERDAQARDLAAQLPLDPATANLQSRLPTDVPGTRRQLGLRVPNGSRIDLRNGQASTPEVINALQH